LGFPTLPARHSPFSNHFRESLNQYVVFALTQNITPAYTIQILPAAEIRTQVERFDALLKQLGAPDTSQASEFLSTREEEEVDAETAQLVARVQEKIADGNR
jgi:hypothetical protein